MPFPLIFYKITLDFCPPARGMVITPTCSWEQGQLPGSSGQRQREYGVDPQEDSYIPDNSGKNWVTMNILLVAFLLLSKKTSSQVPRQGGSPGFPIYRVKLTGEKNKSFWHNAETFSYFLLNSIIMPLRTSQRKTFRKLSRVQEEVGTLSLSKLTSKSEL